MTEESIVEEFQKKQASPSTIGDLFNAAQQEGAAADAVVAAEEQSSDDTTDA